MYDSLFDERCPSFTGILAGISKGECWVNDDENAILAVTYSYCVGGYCILVNKEMLSDEKMIKEELKKLIYENVLPDIKRKNFCEFEFSAEDEIINKLMIELVGDKNLFSELEYSYRTNKKVIEESLLAESYHILSVDQCIIDNAKKQFYKNSDMLLNRLENSWRSDKDFLDFSYANLVLHNVEIVGICFGSSRFKDYIVVDIETHIEHQSKGIATYMASDFVNNCIKKGMTVQWDCVDSNIASKALASRGGFKQFKVRPFYWFEI